MGVQQRVVLVVEDDRDIQAVYTEYFITASPSIKILSAYTTTEGKRLFRTHPGADAIVMDGNMPGSITTVELVHFMRRTYRGPIFATSNDEAMQGELLAAGCDLHCKKHELPQAIILKFGL
jgi:CheY-like chemotaxis protein